MRGHGVPDHQWSHISGALHFQGFAWRDVQSLVSFNTLWERSATVCCWSGHRPRSHALVDEPVAFWPLFVVFEPSKRLGYSSKRLPEGRR